MILSVHAIFGAAVSSLVPTHPVTGFVLGFTSHFVLDAIPHRDYDLISIEKGASTSLKFISDKNRNINLVRDIAFVSSDAAFGLLLTYILFFVPQYPLAFLIGALASYIPDFLTFVNLLLKSKLLNIFYDFHSRFIHSKKTLKVNQLTGIILQYCIVLIFVAIIYTVKSFIN